MTPSKPLPLTSLSKPDLSNLFKNISTIVFDCDGVLYSGANLYECTVPCLRFLRGIGIRVIFLTNNDTMSRDTLRGLYLKAGIMERDTMHLDRIYNSGYAAAKTLRKRYFDDDNAPDQTAEESVRGAQNLGSDHDDKQNAETTTSDSNHESNLDLSKDEHDFSAPTSSLPKQPKGNVVFVIGTEGLKHELDLQNIPSFGYEFSHKKYNGDEVLQNFKDYSKRYNICAVLSGYDRTFNMTKLAFASQCLRRIEGCELYATAADTLIPWKGGNILPGLAPVLKSLELAGEKKVKEVFGKPSTTILNEIMEEHSLKADEILVVGDQLETDIRMANRAGTHSMVVLSGVCSEELIEQTESNDMLPHYVAQDIGVLHRLMEEFTNKEKEQRE